MAPEVNKAAIQALREHMADLKAAYSTVNRAPAQEAPAAASSGWGIEAVQ